MTAAAHNGWPEGAMAPQIRCRWPRT